MTPHAAEAMRILRDPGHFQWTLVPLLGIVVYIYCAEAGKRNWNVLVAGAAYYGIEWAGEIMNSLVLHFTGHAPLWSEPGPCAYLILVGINAETTLMFMVYGLAVAKVLPEDRHARVLGVPNRLLVIAGFAVFCAAVETLLNAWGALAWEWWWWGFPHLWSVTLFAYAPAVAFTIWVHDMRSTRGKLLALGGVYALVVAGFVAFVGVLGWI